MAVVLSSASIGQSSPILSLPQDIRIRIYLYAGLVSDYDHPIDLNCGDMKIDFEDSEDEHAPFQISHDLLLTCQTFYTDILPILYSKNKFWVRHKCTNNFGHILSLSRNAIRSLTSLTIDVMSCGDCWSNEDGSVPLDNILGDPTHTPSQANLEDWQEAASYLLAHIEPFSLRLSLMCACIDIKKAKRIVEPLSAITSLADCRIRLGMRHNHQLQELAQEAVLKAIGQKYPPSNLPIFRFSDLPREIRLQILQYTDLVTPTRTIEWSLDRKFGIRYDDPGCRVFDLERISTTGSSPTCQFRGCRHARDALAEAFCQSQHAAFSKTCCCWAPPTSLMVVCKRFQEDAQEIFYAQNRFVVFHDLFKASEVRNSTQVQVDLMIFLKNVVPTKALSLLRFLDIVFPPLDHVFPKFSSQRYLHWVQTINFLGDVANLAALTLRVHFPDCWNYGDEESDNDHTNSIFDYCREISRPLSTLRAKGLERFFVELPQPPTERAVEIMNEDMSAHTAGVTGMNQWAEWLVMGDEYDSKTLSVVPHEDAEWYLSPLKQKYYAGAQRWWDPDSD